MSMESAKPAGGGFMHEQTSQNHLSQQLDERV